MQTISLSISHYFQQLLLTFTPAVISLQFSYVFKQEINKHFLHLFQLQKVRTNAQKAISDAINKREELRLQSHTHCMPPLLPRFLCYFTLASPYQLSKHEVPSSTQPTPSPFSFISLANSFPNLSYPHPFPFTSY
jgi:hypothetical protein